MSQTLRPTSDISDFGPAPWIITPSGSGASVIDEVVLNTADFISTTGDSDLVVQLSTGTDPVVHTGHIIHAVVSGSIDSGDTLDIALYKAPGTPGILLAQLTVGSGSYSQDHLTYELTPAEAAAITDYAALRLLFAQGNAIGVSNSTVFQAWLELPDLSEYPNKGTLGGFDPEMKIKAWF